MEIKSTRRFFNSDFIIKNKLSLSTVIILQDIYFWILGNNPPKSIIIEGRTYYYISQTHLSNLNYGLLTQPAISWVLKQLKELGIIKSTMVIDYSCNYINFDWNIIKQSVLDKGVLKKMENNEWWKKIHDYADAQIAQENRRELSEDDMLNKGYEIVVKNGRNYLVKKKENKNTLLTDEDMNIERKYCKYSDSIAKRILKKYPTYFCTRYPKDNEKPTKTYTRLCRKIEDIYNGNFLNPRMYSFDENVFKNKQFDTSGWKEKIKEVKGDWNKVRSLIFKAIDNFILMFEEDRMPLSKNYLTNNLNDWFFCNNLNDKGQSQFIQSLNEPMIRQEKLSLDKAKTIVSDIKKQSNVSYESGHELNSLLPPKANEMVAWNNIQNIIKWGKLLYQYDENAKYFLCCEINGNQESGPKVLPALFARYLKENKIGVSLNTLNIEKAIDSNAPWCWFIDEAIKKHNLNSSCVHCLNNEDFFDAYNKNNISFNDMEDVIF